MSHAAPPPAAAAAEAAPASRPVGDELARSPALREALDVAVSEVARAAAHITDARPPAAALKESYDALLRRAADTRGRGLLYPYISSGLGNGALVELMDGSVKWDMICGIGVHFFGHSHPDMIRAALEGSIADTFNQGNLQTGWEAVEFAGALLAEAAGCSRMKHCFPTTSGCMANENALKICYQKRAPASRVIAFQDCFMGRSVTMTQIGDNASYRVGVPLSTLVDYMPFYDGAAARGMAAGDASGRARHIDMCVMHLRQYIERYPGQHACFVFELIQGEGGFNTAPREFFAALMDVCKASNIAVWDDEIQTFGRTTTMFALERLNLGEYVDVLCVGKMTQACATLYTAEYNPGPGLLSGTFTSSAPAFRMGTAAIRRLASGGYYGDDGIIARHHRAFAEQVRALAGRRPEWFPRTAAVPDIVGGIGGMMRFTPFAGDKDKVSKACRHMFDEGVIAFYCGHGPHHVRFLPPVGVMKLDDWPRVFVAVERGLGRVAAE